MRIIIEYLQVSSNFSSNVLYKFLRALMQRITILVMPQLILVSKMFFQSVHDHMVLSSEIFVEVFFSLQKSMHVIHHSHYTNLIAKNSTTGEIGIGMLFQNTSCEPHTNVTFLFFNKSLWQPEKCGIECSSALPAPLRQSPRVFAIAIGQNKFCKRI